ncbi:MAG: hypothetical protein HeimC3_04080 [Candidatus Heimdallarchaeota archaeon LC_3]|nr:MAG: hypothetical protein HeimC3_04080 [Candidatus Heimdallarchaeota archaeon LC_3]
MESKNYILIKLKFYDLINSSNFHLHEEIRVFNTKKNGKLIMSYKIEYAKSSRSTCKLCNEKIMKEEIRVGVPGYFQQYLTYKWQHSKCTTFGAAVPNPEDLEGYNDLNEKDKEKISESVTKVDRESINPTKLKDLITPDKVIDRIDAKITRIGTIQDNTDAGGSIFSSIMISDGEQSMNLMGFGQKPALDLINLDEKGEYEFYGLRTTLSSAGNIVLKHEGASKFVLVVPGVKKKVITDIDWGDFKDLRLTISNRRAKCITCEESILGNTFRITSKGEREVQGKMWNVDQHKHIKCAEVDSEYLVKIWNHVIDTKINASWKLKTEKIDQAFLDFQAIVKSMNKSIVKELKAIPDIKEKIDNIKGNDNVKTKNVEKTLKKDS